MKVTLNLRIDQELKVKLQELAKANNRSMTQQVEHLIATAIRKERGQ
jgi:predicted transcriptional regulator